MKKALLFALGLMGACAAWGQGTITLTTNAPVGTVVKFLPNAVTATQPIQIDWGNGVKVNQTVNPNAAAWQRWVEGTIEGGTITITGNLTELNFTEAQFATASIDGMSFLEKLDLSHNELTSFEIIGTSPLKEVNLAYNKIANTASVNATLGLEVAARTLTNLNLSHNEGLQAVKVDQLKNLEYLTLNDCPDLMSVFLCLPESTLPVLRTINLDNCALSHFYPVTLPSLRSLNLANNQLVSGENDYAPFEMGTYPELTNFDISGNSGIENVDITSCTKLEQFRANDCQLSHIDLSQCPELITLGLKNNKLKSIDLGNNKKISSLYISGNPIKELDITPYDKLKSLDISNTQISRVNLMNAFYLQDFAAAGSLLEWVDFGGQQPNRMTKIDLRNCTSFTQESMSYTLWTLPPAKRAWSENLLLEGSPCEHADFSWAMDTDMNWDPDVEPGDGTATNEWKNVTLTGATLTGERKTGKLDRLYPLMGLELEYDLEVYQTEGGKFLLPQWEKPHFQTIKGVTDKALSGVPMHVYVYPEEGYRFKSVTVNGKEIKSQWFMISEDAEIKVNFTQGGDEPSVAFTVPQGQKLSFLVNTHEANGTIAVDWGTGNRTEYEGQRGYTPGTYQIGGNRIDGTAAGTTVTIYGDLAAVDLSGFGDVAADFGLWDNAISAIDLSNAESLRLLNVYWNPVKSIDLSGCPELQILNVSHTAMTELDLSPVPGLLWLSAYSDGFESEEIMPLSTLDVTMLPRLQYIDAKNNKLTAIDLSHNPMLRWANFNGNKLASIDLSGCPELIELDLSRNELTALDVTGLTKLTDLSVGDNNLTSIDVSKNTALTSLMVSDNAIKTLDTSALAALQMLYINGNGMTADELNDLYYKLPVRIAKDDENQSGIGSLSWNLAVIQSGDKAENDGRRADSSIAEYRGWSPSHTGTNGGSDFAYLDITQGSNGTVKIVDAEGKEYTHGSKVPKYAQLTIQATPAEGYELKGYSLNEEETVYESTFTMPGIYTRFMPVFGKKSSIAEAGADGYTVAAEGQAITVSGEATAVAIHSAAGVLVAAGQAGSYAVEPGIYLVTVTTADGTAATTSVAVR